MQMTTCPKCGFRQKQIEECMRCGIIFNRYHEHKRRPDVPETWGEPETSEPPTVGVIRSCYRIMRWVGLAVVVAAIGLILYPASPPPVEDSAEAAQRAEVKLQQFQSSIRGGHRGTLEMDESELNGWLGDNLALRKPAPKLPWDDHKLSAFDSGQGAHRRAPIPDQDLTNERMLSSVREVRIELREDSLLAYVVFELYGITLSMELEGRLVVEDGYLRLEPSRGRLGSLPLLAGSLDSAKRRLFETPENREKFRLPPQIVDVSIRDSHLLVSSR